MDPSKFPLLPSDLQVPSVRPRRQFVPTNRTRGSIRNGVINPHVRRPRVRRGVVIDENKNTTRSISPDNIGKKPSTSPRQGAQFITNRSDPDQEYHITTKGYPRKYRKLHISDRPPLFPFTDDPNENPFEYHPLENMIPDTTMTELKIIHAEEEEEAKKRKRSPSRGGSRKKSNKKRSTKQSKGRKAKKSMKKRASKKR